MVDAVVTLRFAATILFRATASDVSGFPSLQACAHFDYVPFGNSHIVFR